MTTSSGTTMSIVVRIDVFTKMAFTLFYFLVTYLVSLYQMYPTMSTSTTMYNSGLVLTGWNAHGLNTGYVYLLELLERSDIVVVSEHWLPENELFKLSHVHTEFNVSAVAGQELSLTSSHSWGGVAIFWRKRIDFCVNVKRIKSRRICSISLLRENCQLLHVIGVYMPQTSCKNEKFVDELLILEEMITQYNQSGDVMILGDVNCHFGKECGPRGWGKTTGNAKLLHDLCTRKALTIVDLHDCCGPKFTYFRENCGMSYIDHCIVSNTLIENVVACEVLEDTLVNVSDHLAICIHIDINLLQSKHTVSPSQSPGEVAWHKMSVEDIAATYTCKVEKALARETACPNIYNCKTEDETEKLINLIIDTMKGCCKDLPKKGFNKTLKPFWSHELKSLSKRKKHILYVWRLAGCPRDSDNCIYLEYKHVKKMFRKELRKTIKEYETSNMKVFADSLEVDIKFYWYMVNLSRKVYNKRITPVRLENGQLLTDVNDIKASWVEHYKCVFEPSEHESFDADMYDHVCQEISQLVEKSYNERPQMFNVAFSVSELSECLKSIKKKKAPGWDGITAEHILYGGKTLHDCLLKVFNIMLSLELMPSCLKKGVLISIPKGGKDSTIRENNRGITLLPILYKMYQTLLRNRLGVNALDLLEPVQGAGQKGLSCLHTSFLLREVIQYNTERGNDVYIAFLDAKKAFDSVWILGLMYKLFYLGIDAKLWRVIYNMYTDFYCTVRIGGEYSEWFKIKQGVQQGAPLSMWLYQLYVNDLLILLRKSGFGAYFDDINVTCPAYADDIALVATSAFKLQELIKIAYNHSVKWRYHYNAAKCDIIVVGNTNVKTTFWLGKDCIKVVNKCKHLGTIMTSVPRLLREVMQEKVYKGKQALMAVHGIGNRRIAVSTKILSHIYWSVSVPVMTYGCEVIPMEKETRDVLETAHWDMAKYIQKLPANTPNPCVLPQLGWYSMDCHIDVLKIMFLWRILCMSVNVIYKQIVMKRIYMVFMKTGPLDQEGPTFEGLKVADKYGIRSLFENFVFDGNLPSLLHVKAFVKGKVRDSGVERHRVTFKLYKNVLLYERCFKTYKFWPWFIHVSKCPNEIYRCTAMLRLIVGVERCNDTHKPIVYCYCCPGARFSASHLLFECKDLRGRREELWGAAKAKVPKALLNDLNRMSTDERTVFILSGFESDYIPEFCDMYSSILLFVYGMIKTWQTNAKNACIYTTHDLIEG